MDFLHSHNVCHRDLKSANVLFDRKLHVKLCDFAFSKFRQGQEEAEGDAAEAKFISSVGTPAWMAPEVLRGDECVAAPENILCTPHDSIPAREGWAVCHEILLFLPQVYTQSRCVRMWYHHVGTTKPSETFRGAQFFSNH
jgi:serine/threonine protein kinase